ncbi:MAG TPA: hypothetical protein VGV61_10300 [Thermoanaerobaculia bacterium]|nr:hypothetical protein [Thermoanaerobaculia bacterium]
MLADLAALQPEQRKSFLQQLPTVVGSEDAPDLYRAAAARASSPELRGLVVESIKSMSTGDRQDTASDTLKTLTAPEQEAAVDSAMPRPDAPIRNKLWMMVVQGFTFVLVGSFAALAIGVFLPAKGEVKPELILSMFTSVVGFLAGLFVPSPAASRRTNGADQGAAAEGGAH